MNLKPHYETETYVSIQGYYVIKQIDWEGDEVVVLLSKEQSRKIRDDITAQLREDWEAEE